MRHRRVPASFVPHHRGRSRRAFDDSLATLGRAFALAWGLALLAAGCTPFWHHPGLGGPVAWTDLPGWESDHQAQAWPAFLASCARRANDPTWSDLCSATQAISPTPDDATARAFFETWFQPYVMRGPGGGAQALITGYYTPVLEGSPTKTADYRYPVYGRPSDLLIVDLGALYPELRGKVVRGRVQDGRVIPYYSRSEIEQTKVTAPVLAWVKDPVSLFFLQIQGSGVIKLTDGSRIAVGYADQNGYPYVAVGRCLVDRGAMKPEEVNAAAIRTWLEAHPDQADAVLTCNPSYIFFTLRDASSPPLGSLHVPLTPERSVAVDPAYLPLGAPVYVDTTLPGDPPTPFQRLMLAQDTGGAIKGPGRMDLYLGEGEEAGRIAGGMKQPGRSWVLLPRGAATLTAARDR